MMIKKYPIEIELTNVCGLHCEYCINRNIVEKGFMNEEIFSSVLEYIYLNHQDILYVNLSGVGDVFLHPKVNHFLLKIIKKFSGTGIKILIATKGNFLSETTLKILSNAKKYDVNFLLSFGIFSMNPNKHDAFVQRGGDLKKTIQTIFLVKKYQIDFSLELLFSSYAKDSLESYKNFCQKIGVTPTIHSLHNFAGRIDISGEEILDVKNFCSFERSGSSENFFYENFSRCKFIPFLDYSGNFSLCSLDAHSGNILFSLLDVFDRRYIDLILEFPKYIGKNCQKCSLNK